MERFKTVLLILFTLLVIVLGLHWWGTRELASVREDSETETGTETGIVFLPLPEEETSAGEQGDGEYHTISESPEVKIFQTNYKGGTQIVFNHKQHVEDYGLACIQCHHVEACSKCHLKNRNHSMEVEEGKIALHENCWRCHAELQSGPRECDECHRQ